MNINVPSRLTLEQRLEAYIEIRRRIKRISPHRPTIMGSGLCLAMNANVGFTGRWSHLFRPTSVGFNKDVLPELAALMKRELTKRAAHWENRVKNSPYLFGSCYYWPLTPEGDKHRIALVNEAIAQVRKKLRR